MTLAHLGMGSKYIPICYVIPKGKKISPKTIFFLLEFLFKEFKEEPLWFEVSIPLCLGVTGGGQRYRHPPCHGHSVL